MKSISFFQIQSKSPLMNMYVGSTLLSIAIFDVFVSSFLSVNITSFLPQNISTFLPLIIGFIGLGILRMEYTCLLYTSPSPRDRTRSRMPSSA